MARRGRTYARPAARKMIWFSAGVAQLNVSASNAVLMSTLNAAALLFRPFTVVRTHLIISYESDQLAVSEFSQGAFGMQVVTEPAAAGGITTVPTPVTEVDADYFVYQPLISSFLFSSGVGFSDSSGQANIFTVDSKAMRKVDIDDTIAMTVQNASAFGTNIAVEGRFLVKLH